MTRRLLDRDPLSGVETYWEYRASSDTAVITHVQDVNPILERNKRAFNDDDKTKRGIKKDWWKYAEIPDIVWIAWRNKGLNIFDRNHTKEMFRRLNDPQYQHLKTTSKHHVPSA